MAASFWREKKKRRECRVDTVQNKFFVLRLRTVRNLQRPVIRARRDKNLMQVMPRCE